MAGRVRGISVVTFKRELTSFFRALHLLDHYDYLPDGVSISVSESGGHRYSVLWNANLSNLSEVFLTHSASLAPGPNSLLPPGAELPGFPDLLSFCSLPQEYPSIFLLSHFISRLILLRC